MSATSTTLFVLPVTAGATITAGRAVTAAGAVASAAGNALGIAQTDAATGDLVPVNVIGTAVATAGAAIAVGAAVEVGSAGKVVTKSAGVTIGRALTAAAADGDQVEILLIAN